MRKFFFGILTTTTLFSLVIASRTIGSATPDPAGVQVAQQPNCKNPQTQSAINACAGIEYQNAEKKMKQIYQQLLSKLPDDRKRRLLLAQDAWVSFRAANCEFERSEVAGGTMAPSVYSGCMADLTQERTQRLQKYVK